MRIPEQHSRAFYIFCAVMSVLTMMLVGWVWYGAATERYELYQHGDVVNGYVQRHWTAGYRGGSRYAYHISDYYEVLYDGHQGTIPGYSTFKAGTSEKIYFSRKNYDLAYFAKDTPVFTGVLDVIFRDSWVFILITGIFGACFVVACRQAARQ